MKIPVQRKLMEVKAEPVTKEELPDFDDDVQIDKAIDKASPRAIFNYVAQKNFGLASAGLLDPEMTRNIIMVKAEDRLDLAEDDTESKLYKYSTCGEGELRAMILPRVYAQFPVFLENHGKDRNQGNKDILDIQNFDNFLFS